MAPTIFMQRLSFSIRLGALPRLLLSAALLGGALPAAHAQIISTVAGTGTGGYTGDGGQATSAQIKAPRNLAVDRAGNYFFSDSLNNVIRKVDAAGIISTYVGTGTGGYSGDGGPAREAKVSNPLGIATDQAGNLYIADQYNHVIRKVDTTGVITTVAGKGTSGFSGDGGRATLAQLNGPNDVTVDSAGNLFISDAANNRIRKVDTGGNISTVAGDGTGSYGGDGGPATSAQIRIPTGVAVDSAGNLFIADVFYNYRIRKVDTTGVISTYAGNGTLGYSNDVGQATSAPLSATNDLTVDSAGNLFFPEYGRIRKVDTSGVISIVAGDNRNDIRLGDGGPATSASLSPSDVAINGLGNLLIADKGNDRIRKVDTGVAITQQPQDQTVFAGSTVSFSAMVSGLVSATGPNILADGAQLNPGQSLVSSNLGYQLKYQNDGNLVLNDAYGKELFASKTSGTTPGKAIVQRDGNFVVYDAGGVARYATGTNGSGAGNFLKLQDDGNLVLYDASTKIALFATGTNQSGNPVPTVQWQVSTDGGATFTDIPGATRPTYSFTSAISNNNSLYRAVFARNGASVASNAAKLTVMPVAATSGALLSQFCYGGPGGTADEFIELVNTTNAPLLVNGWSVIAGSVTVPVSGTIPANGHLLLTNSGGYSLGIGASGDISYTGDISPGATITLKNAQDTVVDTVSDPPIPPDTGSHAYIRRIETGVPSNTGTFNTDWNIVATIVTNSTVGASGVGPYNGIRLGSPNPHGLASTIQRNAGISNKAMNIPGVYPIARYVSKGSGVDSKGRLTIRRTITNNTGGNVTKLRFRIVAITGGTSTTAGVADLRAISSGGVRYYDASNGNAITQAAYGMLIEAPTNPANVPLASGATGTGGGLNAGWEAYLPSINSNGFLAPGESVNVEFLFGIQAEGRFRVVLDAELLP